LPALEKINIIGKGRVRVLFAPLDWGLGHTTRCLPIIKAFQSAGAEITIACNEKQTVLLQAELEAVRFLPLRGYGLRYSRSKYFTWFIIALQIPKILTAINREKKWLSSIFQTEGFDVVISDNRYGLHHPSLYSIFISHQLRVRVPFSKWIENLLQKWNYNFIQQFSECWIPDFEGASNLAGDLSHPNRLPAVKLKYIGAVSWCKKMKKYSEEPKVLVVIISGPEPQRTIFEKIVLSELNDWNESAVVLRGLPATTETLPSTRNVTFFNHLHSVQLSDLINRATYIVARSGYSTIMDIVALQKKSILIPTPGQTEQEYLGNWLMEHKFCVSITQNNFSLKNALSQANQFEYADLSKFPTDQYENAVSSFMREHFKETIQPDVSKT